MSFSLFPSVSLLFNLFSTSSSFLSRKKNKNRKRSQKARWTQDEDKLLRSLVKEHDAKNWKKISESFPERTDVQCLHRWQKVLNPNLIKGPWTPEEDAKVKALVKELGPKKWSIIASNLPGRIGKQCRERWWVLI